MAEPANDLDRSLVIDDSNAPEIFVSGVMGFAPEAGGIVKISFGTLRRDAANPKNSLNQVVNLHVVMTAGSLADSLRFLSERLAAMQQANSPPPPGTPVQ